MSKLSHKNTLEIANICYAVIAGEFADFCNERNRGVNFSWDKWLLQCESKVPFWFAVNSKDADNPQAMLQAKEYSKQIAMELLQRAGFITIEGAD